MVQRSLMGAWLLAAACAGGPAVVQAEEADPELVELVIELLGDSDREIRSLAFEQIRNEAPGATATRRFAEQLPSLEPEEQAGLLRALAARGDAAARPAIGELLAGEAAEAVRATAITTLGALGDASDVGLLANLLGQGDRAEREAARKSLIQLRGDEAGQAILDRMVASDPELKAALIEVLAERRVLSALDPLVIAASDDSAIVRRAAMEALARLAGPEQIPGMVRGVLAAESGAERAAAEKAIMRVCQRTEDRDLRAQPLLAAMEDLEEPQRLILLSTLGRVGGAEALATVKAALNSEDSQVHSAGVRALSNWPDATASEQLVEVVEADEHPGHRITALRALIRVAPLPDGRTDEQKLQLLKRAMGMSTRDEERIYALQRAAAIRLVETLRFVLPYLQQPAYAEQAAQTIVELAHHRGLREPHQEEFHRALDRVMETSTDAVVIDRARRYKNNQTWVRPK